MYQIRTTGQKLGPFKTVATLSDRYRVNGVADIPFTALDSPGVVEAYDGFLPEPTTPIPPESITMRQARLTLLEEGKLSLVDAAIDSLPSPQKEAARIEWEYSSTVLRNGPLVAAIGAAIGYTSTQIDQLFIKASTK